MLQCTESFQKQVIEWIYKVLDAEGQKITDLLTRINNDVDMFEILKWEMDVPLLSAAFSPRVIFTVFMSEVGQFEPQNFESEVTDIVLEFSVKTVMDSEFFRTLKSHVDRDDIMCCADGLYRRRINDIEYKFHSRLDSLELEIRDTQAFKDEFNRLMNAHILLTMNELVHSVLDHCPILKLHEAVDEAAVAYTVDR